MKLLYISPNASDALAFYRGSGPLSSLRRHSGIDYTIADGVTWATLTAHDAVFFQRPFTGNHLEVIELCRKWGVPFTVDFDDWLYELSPDNPAYHIYQKNRTNYHTAAEIAHRLTVSTEDMASMYRSRFGIEATVVPNAYDTDLFRPRQLEDHSKIVLWRGSNSHAQDLFSVRQGWLELIRKHRDWQFLFINCPPWFLGDSFDNVKVLPPLDVLDYMNILQQIKPAIMTHPLLDCSFNRSKSMCSWIEASHAGAAFVGPDFKEYERPGLTRYEPGSSESFFRAIDGLIEDPSRIIENARLGQAEITGPLALREVNKIRERVFKDLLRQNK